MRWMFSLLIFIAVIGCTAKQSLADVEYVKVLSFGRADSITAYNKGLGLNAYAFFQPKTDSLSAKVVSNLYKGNRLTWVEKLQNPAYADTIIRSIDALRKYPTPITFDTTYTGDTYCGPELYVEYKDLQGLHYNVISMGYNDTLDQFCRFFNRLENLSGIKKVVDNNLIDMNEEAVTSIKRLGLYDKKETPYIPSRCENKVEKTKIYGVWRRVDLYSINHQNSYTTLTITRNGILSVKRILDGKLISERTGQFILSDKGNVFITVFENIKQKTEILKLSDNCFECKITDSDCSVRYDRLTDQETN